MIAHSPRAPVDIWAPEPPGYCDRCGFKVLHRNLAWQYDWRGSRLANLRLLVCPTCIDEPQPNGRRPIKIGPDPVPVRDPRPGFAGSQMYEGPDSPIKGSAQEILGEPIEPYWQGGIDWESDQNVETEKQTGRWRYG